MVETVTIQAWTACGKESKHEVVRPFTPCWFSSVEAWRWKAYGKLLHVLTVAQELQSGCSDRKKKKSLPEMFMQRTIFRELCGMELGLTPISVCFLFPGGMAHM